MSQLDREGLISQSNFLFPDNTTREITPADLRTFNTDVADSLQITGSSVISASYADASGFASSSDWSGINNIPSGLVSGSSQVSDITGSSIIGASIVDATTTYEKGDTTTFDLTVDNVDNAVSASYALTASVLLGSVESASYADNALSASHAEFADEAENAEHADAVEYPVIAKETLDKGDPVYVSGYNNGEEKPEVLKADASDPTKMPVVGLAKVDASNNDHIFVVAGGSFPNVDTSNGLTSPEVGDVLYVASGGGYTNVKPTGTNLIQNVGVIGRVQQNSGEIVVSAIQRSNDLPNIQEGYYWVGDSNGVPQPQLSQSVDVGVTSIIAGTNISIDQGTGDVTVSAPNGLISGSDQVTASLDTRYEERGSGIVSSSAQITPLLPTGTVSGSYVSSIIAGANVSIDQGTGDVTISASGTAIDTGSFATTGSNTFVAGQTISAGNLELSGTGQIINNAQGSVEANEVAANTALFNKIEPNTETRVSITSDLEITGSVTASQGIKASEGSITTGNLTFDGSGQILNIINGTVEANEVATSNILLDSAEPNAGTDITFNSNLIVSGSTKTETQVLTITSLTSSVDFNQTDMHELTLVASVDTHLTATNVGKGQTINILVKQASGGSGTLSFDTEFLQPSGSEYTATSDANAEDILTLVTFNDTNKIYVAAVNKLQ